MESLLFPSNISILAKGCLETRDIHIHQSAPSTTLAMSSNPPISVSKIPSLKELSDQLGFQSASLKDTSNFMEGTRAWRKSFKTSSGRLGTTLLQWKDLSTQQDLEEMAQRFVDHKNNSDRFWSSQRDWFQDSNIEFPEDRAQ